MLTFLTLFMVFCTVLTAYALAKTFLVRRELLENLKTEEDLGYEASDSPLEAISLLNRALTLQEMAALEGELLNLAMVVVVAHTIERPRDLLRDAYENNLARGVMYRFLVSPSELQAGTPIYFRDFQTSAESIRKRQALSCSVNDMVDIQPLAFEWEDAPYIFYRQEGAPDRATSKPASFSQNATIAFRGESRRTGLANSYIAVPPALAHTLVRSLMATAPSGLRESVEGFDGDTFAEPEARVLEFESHGR
jgi:hypothetical protein